MHTGVNGRVIGRRVVPARIYQFLLRRGEEVITLKQDTSRSTISGYITSEITRPGKLDQTALLDSRLVGLDGPSLYVDLSKPNAASIPLPVGAPFQVAELPNGSLALGVPPMSGFCGDSSQICDLWEVYS